jgi:N-acetylmuramoyl-L-alanine amidase
LIRREIKAIHEYGADSYATAETDTYEYASLLLMNCAGHPLSFTNPFFKNQIKRRIKMMTNSQSNKKGLLGRFMILPLIAVFICLFSFKMQTSFHLFSTKPLRVVIDAGHGGVDPGTSVNGIPEKNINLQIAKKIQQLASAYHVEVIMTRETDVLPGNGENIENALKYRAELPGRENADLFISIHTNGLGKNEMQDTHSGFDIYIPGNSSKVYDGSVKLASIITGSLKPDYTISPELKQSATGVMVLNNASVPSILIECGYIDNKADLAYLQNEKSQEKIARDILEGIRKYADQ